MSVATYTTSVLEHTQILVSVKCSSDVDAESVQFVLKRLDAHKSVVINDAGCTIHVKFSRNASPQNCLWGSFQAHRQVYGLVYIAQASNAMEAALVMDKFNKLRDEYGPDVYHSRCLIFGIDTAIRQSHSHNVFQFSSYHAWKSADYDIKQFIVSIFYDLESKRLKMSQEKSRPSLIFATFETAEERNFEIDSKATRKKFLGRHYKHLADIHLLLGIFSEALLSYNNALDMLVSTNDSVWVGCALEGLCVVSAMVLLSELEGVSTDQAKECGNKIALDPRNLAIKQGPVFNTAELKKHCIPTIKDLVDKYREAIIHYSRYKSLAVVEMEACIKATKVFAKAKKYLEASEFIQNAVYITLNVSEEERLERYSVMADLYKDIDFRRKSFFYKRVAAMQCVAPQLKSPDWKHCNGLLLAAISSLSSDLSHFPYNVKVNGWPSVIHRVWRELVFSLERVGDHVLAYRHLLHVFVSMFPFMTESDEKETVTALENYAKNHKENVLMPRDKFPFVLDFYRLPIVKAILPQIDVGGVRPIRSKLERSPQSVFIYTPTPHQTKAHDHRKIEFDWCVNSACCIYIEVHNPLSYSTLQVSEFSFVVDEHSSTLDCPPVSFSVHPATDSKIPIIITPLDPGEVKIVGYAFQIFGTQMKCYFDKIDEMTTSEVIIDVIPELPLLQCVPSTKGANDTEIPVVTAYCGEICQLPFTMVNVGKHPVSSWMISCKTKKLTEEFASLLFEDDLGGVVLDSGKSLALPVKIKPNSKISAKVLAELHPCTVSIKYAAKLKDQGTWWRSTDVEMELRFKRSVTVEHLTICNQNGGSSSYCMVSATLRSFLEDTVDVHYVDDAKVDQSFTLQPLSIRTYQMRMTKAEHSKHLRSKGSIEDICLGYLKERLCLIWKFSSDQAYNHSGAVCFECRLAKECICTMLNVPISCSVAIKNINGNADAVVQTGDLCSICIDFSNRGAFSQNFNAQLEVFQDQQNGYIEWNLDESVLCLGCNSFDVSVEPSSNSQFECDIVALKAGIYLVRATYDLNLTGSGDLSVNIQCSSPSLQIHAES